MGQQIKSFVSFFLNIPQTATGYYGNLLNSLINKKSDFFIDGHDYLPYYLSGLALYRLESLFRSKNITPEWKPYRFFILMMFRHLVQKERLNDFSSRRKVDNYCKPISEILLNYDSQKELFQESLRRLMLAGLRLEEENTNKSAATLERIQKYIQMNVKSSKK